MLIVLPEREKISLLMYFKHAPIYRLSYATTTYGKKATPIHRYVFVLCLFLFPLSNKTTHAQNMLYNILHNWNILLYFGLNFKTYLK